MLVETHQRFPAGLEQRRVTKRGPKIAIRQASLIFRTLILVTVRKWRMEFLSQTTCFG